MVRRKQCFVIVLGHIRSVARNCVLGRVAVEDKDKPSLKSVKK